MTFVSFAQNFEDVLLFRCFGHQPTGFYVDVGASTPVVDNVSHAFYERGWSGINIDPIPQRIDEFKRVRPRDKNLCLAAGLGRGLVKFYRTRGVGGLSTIQPHIGEEMLRTNSANVWCLEVSEAPLSDILAEQGVKEIDFLKIDVEGAELRVLQGLNLDLFRPAVILIEATLPMSQTPTYAQWEALLLEHNYAFAYFDGINRFYVSRERAELLPHFATPPNIFDKFVTFRSFRNPLRNPTHPDHGFALHLAGMLLRAVGLENNEQLQQILTRDMPPQFCTSQVTRQSITECYKMVLGRAPRNEEVEVVLQAHPARCGADLMQHLLASEEFLNRRARISAF